MKPGERIDPVVTLPVRLGAVRSLDDGQALLVDDPYAEGLDIYVVRHNFAMHDEVIVLHGTGPVEIREVER